MKKYVFRTLKILVLFMLIVTTLSFLQNFFFSYNDDNKVRIRGFYLEPENSIDVALIGASDVYCGFSSCYAYNNYGYTSYPFAIPSDPVSLWKYQLKEILKHQQPKQIVIEINGTLYNNDEYVYDDAIVRRLTDNIPFSAGKLEAISNVDNDYLSHIFPFIKYHSNYMNIKDCKDNFMNTYVLFKRGYSLLKGNFATTSVFDYSNTIQIDNKDEKIPLNENLEKYLIEFLEFCKEENIYNILFIRLPHCITSQDTIDRYKRTNMAQEIIESYGYDFINFEKDYELANIDFKEDFANEDHLNIFGQKKITKYISELLINKYNLKKSNLSEENKVRWDNCAKFYEKFYNYIEYNINTGIETELNETASLLDSIN